MYTHNNTQVRYDGVYRILRCWRKKGKNEHKHLICRYIRVCFACAFLCVYLCVCGFLRVCVYTCVSVNFFCAFCVCLISPRPHPIVSCLCLPECVYTRVSVSLCVSMLLSLSVCVSHLSIPTPDCVFLCLPECVCVLSYNVDVVLLLNEL
jgi:hypothetical protein